MLSNLIKSNYIYFKDTEKRVIDSNSRNDLFVQRINPTVMKEDENEKSLGFVEGLNAITIDIIEEDNIEEKVSDILASANEQAEQIINEAIIKASVEKEAIFDIAKTDGYSHGYIEGQKEIAKLTQDLVDKAITLEQDYEKKISEIEPNFVGLLMDYLRKLTGLMVEDHKEIIGHLIHQAILGSENSKSYTIKVSKEDYPYVCSMKEEIVALLKYDAELEILEESKLSKNECLIDTDNRIIDCGLNVQLENLITDLKILSQA